MERFRGLVQRFGVGGGVVPSGFELTADQSRTEELLEKLPLTKAFVEQLPRATIIAAANENDAKASEALRLVKRVDALIESHATAANCLRDYVPQITAMKSEIDKAALQAKNLQTQLTELESLLLTFETHQTASELRELQRAEDAKFEAYARSRRTLLSNKKAEYARQLDSFALERISVLSEVSRPSTPISGGFTSPRRIIEDVAGRLESVDIVEEEDKGLDEFLGEPVRSSGSKGKEEEAGLDEFLSEGSSAKPKRGGKKKGEKEKEVGKGRKVLGQRRKAPALVMADEDFDESMGW
ncbi:hypothetical protein RUND412_004252 [Rhizina undulata]